MSDKYINKQEVKSVCCLTVVVPQTVWSASLRQKGAEPGSVQAAQPKAAQAEGAVVQVQAQSAQQQDDGGSVAALDADGQRPTEVLFMGAAAEQELHQLQGASALTHLRVREVQRGVTEEPN